MKSFFIVVPQWQGSGSARAMRLIDGAEQIRHELSAHNTQMIDVPLEAGDSEATGVLRWSSIRLVRERLERELVDLVGIPIVIGGDCGVEYGAIEHARREGPVVLVWADAHADLNTAASSPSKAFHGMVLRSLIDDQVVAAENVLLLGVRDLDDAEAAFIDEAGLRRVTAADVETAVSERVEAIRAAGDEPQLYIHIDLDVLDPAVFEGVGFPAPFGLELSELTTAVAAARAVVEITGAGLMEFAPPPSSADDSHGSSGDDLTVILRIIAALSR